MEGIINKKKTRIRLIAFITFFLLSVSMLTADILAPKHEWKNTFEIGHFNNGFIIFDERTYQNAGPLIIRNGHCLGLMLCYPGLLLFPDGALVVLSWNPCAFGIFIPV